jgi:CRISPR/Cas system-associated endoribonuclease Cas2
LVWPKLNRALRQIVHHQAGLQGGQHDQYRPNRENRRKITMLKKSLQEIQRPDSDSIRFHRFRS